jgi:DNA (cytosine-5)-methyltransferase 1
MFNEGVEAMKSCNGEKKQLKFVDFCAGIGGGRIGLEKAGMQCVGFSETARESVRTYREFFGESERNHGDLMKINPADLPDFDVMIAGFPCQTFSVIGPRTGMQDRRGQIIFGLIDIMTGKNLKYFILENVKGLLNHGGGESLSVILKELEQAGYKIFWKLVNSLYFGVPQMRERIYFVGVRKDLARDNATFEFPRTARIPDIKKYLVDDDEKSEFNEKRMSYATFLQYLTNKYNRGMVSTERLLKENFLVIDTRQSDLRLYRGRTPTLRTGRHGILYVRDGKFRRLSARESLLLQGFPEELAGKVKGKIDEMSLLSQAGNAMTVNVVEAIGKKLLDYINAPAAIEKEKYEERRLDKVGVGNR